MNNIFSIEKEKLEKVIDFSNLFYSNKDPFFRIELIEAEKRIRFVSGCTDSKHQFIFSLNNVAVNKDLFINPSISKLKKIVPNLPNGNIEFSYDAETDMMNGKVPFLKKHIDFSVRNQNNQNELMRAIEVTESKELLFSMTTKEFIRAIESVSHSVAKSDNRPTLNHVNFSYTEQDGIEFITADGYRLTIYKVPTLRKTEIATKKLGLSFNVLAKTLGTMIKVMQTLPDDTEVSVYGDFSFSEKDWHNDSNVASFVFGDYVVNTIIYNGRFPDAKALNLIENPPLILKIGIDKKKKGDGDIFGAMNMTKAVNGISNFITFDGIDDLRINAKSPERNGDISVPLNLIDFVFDDAQKEWASNKVAGAWFDPAFLSDALSVFSEKNAILSFGLQTNEEGKVKTSMRLTSNSNPNCVIIFMPMSES